MACLDELLSNISIHAPPRGATKITAIDPIPDRISIHAPPRGATGGYRWVATRFRISIHAPPRGATSNIRRTRCVGYFNSRPSARGDDTRVGIPSCNVISIHAPPRGATYATTSYVDEKTDFNSRPSARGDSQSQQPPAEAPAFQFTPLREGRQRARKARRHATARFQFTPLREGRLTLHDNRAEAGKISIHAPPRGATPAGQPTSTISHFNSRPSARGDRRGRNLRVDFPISIHAPPRGATPHAGEPRSRRSISIHAPPRGATTFAG